MKHKGLRQVVSFILIVSLELNILPFKRETISLATTTLLAPISQCHLLGKPEPVKKHWYTAFNWAAEQGVFHRSLGFIAWFLQQIGTALIQFFQILALFFSINSRFSLTATKPIQKVLRVPTFETALKKAIESKVIHSLLGLDEKVELELVETVQKGDRHNYFVFHEITFGVFTTTVVVSYLIEHPDGFATREFETFTLRGFFPTREKLNFYLIKMEEKLFLKLQQLTEQGSLPKEGKILKNATKLVILKDREGNFYKVYYKHGLSAVMEKVGAELFRSLGIAEPKIIFAPEDECVWIENIEAKNFLDFIVSQTQLKEHKRAGRIMPIFVHELTCQITPSVRKLFQEIGRIAAMLYLLGHMDEHMENYLVSPDMKATMIDFETLGQKDLIKKNWTEDPTEVMKSLYGVMYGLFKTKFGENLKIPEELKYCFSAGIKEVACSEEVIPKLEKALDKVLRESSLYSRIVIRLTSSYSRFVIPHYSIPVNPKHFVAVVKERQTNLARFITHFRLAPHDDHSLCWFEFISPLPPALDQSC